MNVIVVGKGVAVAPAFATGSTGEGMRTIDFDICSTSAAPLTTIYADLRNPWELDGGQQPTGGGLGGRSVAG